MQDHGHAPQVHSGEKEKHIQKINVGDDGQGNTFEPDHARSTNAEDHHAAEGSTRSGLQTGDSLVVARGVKVMGILSNKGGKENEKLLGMKDLMGIAPQPIGSERLSVFDWGFNVLVLIRMLS